MRAVLILDLGTTNIKAIIYGEEGTVVAESSMQTPVVYSESRMEIDPEEMWEASKTVCRDVISRLNSSINICSLSISSMAATLIPVDEEGKPVYSAIGWADGRPLNKMNSFLDKFNKGYRIKGCGQYPLPMYAAFKIPWFSDEEKEVSKRIFKWVNISDYIYSCFLGTKHHYTDYSIASRTMLFNDINKRWNEEALKEFNISSDLLPVPYASGTVIGEVGEPGYEIGLNGKTTVVLGGHDHMCASLGAAVTRPGILLNSTGTSEAIVTMLKKPYKIEELPTHWINSESSVINDEIMAVSYTAASGQIFNSMQDTFLGTGKDKLNALFADYMNPLNEPIFIPSLRGSLPAIKGSFICMPSNFNGKMLSKAILEGIYYECRRVCERVSTILNIEESIVRIVGGQTRDDVALQAKCNVLGLPVERPREINISAKGAFILAAVSCGIFNSVKEASEHLYSKLEKDVFYPDSDMHNLYNEIYSGKYLTYFSEGIFSL